MRSSVVYHAVDSHTEGMPTRVVVGGVGAIPGDTMFDRRRYFMAHLDGIRRALMYEPRGHAAMSGAILQPPARPDADWGVVFIEVSGCLPMCGHGAIGVATVLVETGMVEVTEPVTRVALDTPAGLVIADVAVRDGTAVSVSIRNVPAFTLGLDQVVAVDGRGPVSYDMAFGGNFYAILSLDQVGIPFDRARKNQILSAGLDLMAAINAQSEPVHPDNPEIRGCHHVQFLAPGADARHSRHAMAIYPGWFDRSPCGTGTSARLAQLHTRGQIEVGAELINESFIGSRFTGSIVEETTVRDTPAVIPKITGRAWITGTAQYVIAPDDPFPEGFQL
ncbi:MAG: proline racemase family protein [Actinomycetota bacterium]|nr:proline racemase family protein [Actinomycetota bacterium]